MSSIVFASLSVRTREDSSRGTEGEAKVVVETEPATMHFEFAAPASGWQPVEEGWGWKGRGGEGRGGVGRTGDLLRMSDQEMESDGEVL